ncbi:VOC family protein [Rhodohalobacter halophilus]|uniref:VOC family protein n=1 Tax=Rhodohalobacter halophilus TaxID=1812810 RepID=UPI00083FD32A|nr:VOC family protein [Rhodohalobacter halophilus]
MTQSSKSVTVGWFEIPVKDMGRAIKFYNSIFDTHLNIQSIQGVEMAFFPWNEEEKGAGGSLIKADDHYKPSHDGTLIYFSSDDVNIELKRIKKAGGNILQKKTEITPDIGFMALIEDTEGNRIALHSKK